MNIFISILKLIYLSITIHFVYNQKLCTYSKPVFQECRVPNLLNSRLSIFKSEVAFLWLQGRLCSTTVTKIAFGIVSSGKESTITYFRNLFYIWVTRSIPFGRFPFFLESEFLWLLTASVNRAVRVCSCTS